MTHREQGGQERSIRSFVKRTGRMTLAQKQGLAKLWPVFGVDYKVNATLDFEALFPGKKRAKLEIGFGNGEALVKMAMADPESGYLGIEVHEPGVGHCLNNIHQAAISNARLMKHDAVDVLRTMIPEASLDAVFLFFPDPWHKKRHHKRRIVNSEFRQLILKVLKPEGVLHMATDWQDYAEHMAHELLNDDRFTNLGDDQGFCAKPGYRPETRFERRGHRLGHGVWDLLFARR